ncbi:hypothetical protein FB451DRAFT_1566671, partial [Mycena latifolia]
RRSARGGGGRARARRVRRRRALVRSLRVLVRGRHGQPCAERLFDAALPATEGGLNDRGTDHPLVPLFLDS